MANPSFKRFKRSANSVSPAWFFAAITFVAVAFVFKGLFAVLALLVVYRLIKAPSEVFPMLMLLGFGALLSRWMPTVGTVVVLIALFGVFFSGSKTGTEAG